MKKTFKITDDDGAVRVDKHLAVLFPEYSRSALAKLFLLKLIKLKGEPIQPGYKLRPGAEIEYDLTPLQAVPEVIPLPIIFENNDIVVIDKPAGIISHSRGKFWQEASVASFIRDKVSNATGERAGIVHRLDRATSGVMICAKKPETLSKLQKQFSDRKVQKSYLAVVSGKPKIDQAIIDAPIARNTKTPRKFMVDKDGKQSQTKYTVIKQNKLYTTMRLEPKTGRTHQLRVHLDYINLPIVGDDLYGGKEYSRLMLHAHKITIELTNGKTATFTADVPEKFEKIYKDGLV